MGKYLELEPPSPSLGVHRFKKDGRRILMCVPEWKGGGGKVSLCTASPRVLCGGMVQSGDMNGKRRFGGKGIPGGWNTGVRAYGAEAVG